MKFKYKFNCQNHLPGGRITALGAIFFALTAVSCKKLVEVNPPVTSITGASVYTSDATSIAAVTGLYTKMSGSNYTTFALPTLSMYAALSSDELALWSGATNTSLVAYYTNNLSASLSIGPDYWNNVYPYIFTCNSAIEGLGNASGLTPAIKQQLLGEAKFMRAFFYFYLTNLYGDIPMPLNTNYQANVTMARTPKVQVCQQIIHDLSDAQTSLSTGYLDATLLKNTTDRTRPTKWAATALLARVYLYVGDWADAEAQATAVLNSSLFNLPALNAVFLKNSAEAIWQLQPVSTSGSTNTFDALEFIIPSTGPGASTPVYLSNSLLTSFESGDNRKTSWVGSVTASNITYYYPYKYKANSPTAPVTEYLMLFRLGEQYLIRAETRAQQGSNLSGSLSDLNMIRTRAGLPNVTVNTQPGLLAAIQHERQVEMFTEMGQRWLDLKRTGTVDAIMKVVAPQKRNSTWNTNQQLYPLPLTDIQDDPNLIQNPGY